MSLTIGFQIRIFLITAQYCNLAVYKDSKRTLIEAIKKGRSSTLSIFWSHMGVWWYVISSSFFKKITHDFHRLYTKRYYEMRFAEFALDTSAALIKTKLWTHGLMKRGFRGAHLAASGLRI